MSDRDYGDSRMVLVCGKCHEVKEAPACACAGTIEFTREEAASLLENITWAEHESMESEDYPQLKAKLEAFLA